MTNLVWFGIIYCMSDQIFLFEEALKDCAQKGLNLSAVIDIGQLPKGIQAMFSIDLTPYRRLVLLGNGGRPLWNSLDAHGWHGNDPVDTFSLTCVQSLLSAFSYPADQHLILYPLQPHIVPLQQLGQFAGWGEPSPIGNSIHSEYGLWFAFRAAFLTTAELPVTPPLAYRSPCETCQDKPCQTACPAGAVLHTAQQFKLNACIDHRLKAHSSCQTTCLARLACPVGAEHRYPPHVIQHLYASSVKSIEKWRARPKP